MERTNEPEKERGLFGTDYCNKTEGCCPANELWRRVPRSDAQLTEMSGSLENPVYVPCLSWMCICWTFPRQTEQLRPPPRRYGALQTAGWGSRAGGGRRFRLTGAARKGKRTINMSRNRPCEGFHLEEINWLLQIWQDRVEPDARKEGRQTERRVQCARNSGIWEDSASSADFETSLKFWFAAVQLFMVWRRCVPHMLTVKEDNVDV